MRVLFICSAMLHAGRQLPHFVSVLCPSLILKPLRELSWRPLSRSGGQHGAKMEPKWSEKLSRNLSEIDPKSGPEMDPEMTLKWYPTSIGFGLPNLHDF